MSAFYSVYHSVITTEKVPFTYRVAGVGARALAWMVDACLLVLLLFIGNMYAGLMEGLRPGIGVAVFLFWFFGCLWGYFLLFEWLWHGQTPGKRLLGIRVIQWRGTSLTFLQSAVRNIVRLVDALPAAWLFFGIYPLGFAVAIGNRKHLRLGDWAAGTLVVHVERRAGPIRALHDGPTKAGPADGRVRLKLAQLTRAQKQDLLDLCLRRDQLRLADRAQLFHAVAQYMEQELGIAPEEHQSDEKFVLRLAAILGEGSGV
jgi:uncharacterized RDD family membrane protein YckC